MTELLEPIWVAHHTQTEALSAMLHRLGFTTVVLDGNKDQPHPSVWVKYGACEEFVYAAPDNDGRWWFWWGTSMLPLTPDVEVSKAADSVWRRITRMMGER